MQRSRQYLKEQQKKSSAKARRSAARLTAVQAVYQMAANDQSAKAVVEEFAAMRFGMTVDDQGMVMPDAPLFSEIVRGVDERSSDLDTLISDAASHGGRGEGKKDLKSESLLYALLLCGSWELLAKHDTDAPVIISDYIDVAHAFFEKGEAKLVNGILDRVKHYVRDAEPQI